MQLNYTCQDIKQGQYCESPRSCTQTRYFGDIRAAINTNDPNGGMFVVKKN